MPGIGARDDGVRRDRASPCRPGLRLPQARLILDRAVGLAAELRQGGLGLALADPDALQRGVKVALGLIERRLRAGAAPAQFR